MMLIIYLNNRSSNLIEKLYRVSAALFLGVLGILGVYFHKQT